MLVVHDDHVVIQLALWERLVALHGNVRVPVSAVRSATIVADPVEDMKDYQSLGNTVTQRFVYGVRRVPGIGKAFVAARGHRPAVLVQLDPASKFVRLLVTVADPDATVASIRSAARV